MLFEEAAYEQARDSFLQNVAYMQQSNERFAELRGGIEQMNEADLRRYNAIKLRLIDLVAYHDAAEAYIASLGAYVEDLTNRHRQLAAEQREQEQGWQRYFPRLAPQGETAREHSRQLAVTQAQMNWPELY